MVGVGDNLVLLGMFCAPHGVRGHVKVKTFTDRPDDIAAYGLLFDETNNSSYSLSVVTVLKNDFVIAKIAGVDNRTQAEALKNIKLFCRASCLPRLHGDEYYKNSLIGLRVELTDGSSFGTVSEVFNFGSGDILEIKTPAGKTKLFPFNQETFPHIDISSGIISLRPPETVGAV
ncbi:ribosome maturation factor RimM [Anaplasma platys]|nr:ribosome maturation factor RimM [Anaplasma platys]